MMSDIITEVIRDKGRVQVVVNGEEKLHFSRSAFSMRSLTAGDSVDLRELKEWLLVQQYPEALSKAVAFLAVRSRSRLEVRRKLEGKGYLERTIELVLYKLEREDLLDDEAFAREWARARIQRQFGKRRILRELYQKGVSRDIAERVMRELESEPENESERELADELAGETERNKQSVTPARMLAHKLLRRVQSEPDHEKGMRKVLAAFIRRGFSYEEAGEAIRGALKEMEEADD